MHTQKGAAAGRPPNASGASDDVGFDELRQLLDTGADGNDKVHAVIGADGFQPLKDPFAGGKLVVDELFERVDEDQAHVEVLRHDAAEKAHEHMVAEQVVLAGVDKAHLMTKVEHIAIVIVDENDVVLAFLASLVGHVDDALGFTRALFAGNHLNQW